MVWVCSGPIISEKWEKRSNVRDFNTFNDINSDGTYSICNSHLLLSASSADSGSSFLLVSGSRKLRAPLTRVRLLKTVMGMTQWYMAKMLSRGARKLPILPDIAPIATAVCLKGKEWKMIHTDISTFGLSDRLL